jgi:DNA-directed RNA polymerase subunit RPC12/RpoP
MTMAKTAEWICTRCGSTNRRLVDDAALRSTDACVTCHAKHDIEADVRPVRWRAKPVGG